MLKKDSGITMISLVITIIVLIILASITTYSGISSIKDSKYYNGINQMKLMQSEVNRWYEDKKNGNTNEWDKGIEISESGKQVQCIKAFNSASVNNLYSTNIGEIAAYKYFSEKCIKDDLDLEGISNDFIINIDTRTVILVDGVKMAGKFYYSLGEIEGEQYNVEYTE